MSNVNASAWRIGSAAEGESQEKTKVLRPVRDESPGVEVAPTVRDLVPYETVDSQAAIASRSDQKRNFKLDWNECTIAQSPAVSAAIAEFLANGGGLNWYPKLGSQELISALTSYTGVAADHLLVSNGSDDGLRLICSTYLDRGDEVVIPVPTYNHFMVFAESRGAKVVTVQGEDAFDCNLAGIEAKMSETTRLLYLVSPNNPTGMIIEPQDVAELCERYPSTLIVLDEAYFEFSQITGIGLVEKYRNLVVTRTFSKAFGLAGLRIGYLAACPELIEGMRRIYNPKSVNTLGQIGAVAALGDLPYLDDFLKEVRASKEILREFFEARSVEAHITAANFVVIRVDEVPQMLKALEDRGIYVRDRSSYPGLEGCIRMSVGTTEQTERLLGRIEDLF